MPFYEYECSKCSCRFEHVSTIEDRCTAACPRCGCYARLLISLSTYRIEQPATIRYADGRIFAQRPRDGAVPPPCPPMPEQRDKELAMQ